MISLGSVKFRKTHQKSYPQIQKSVSGQYAIMIKVARARELTSWAREALRQAESDDERKDEVVQICLLSFFILIPEYFSFLGIF